MTDFSVEVISSVTEEVVSAVTRLAPELHSSNQMSISAETLAPVATLENQVWYAAREQKQARIVGMVVLVMPHVFTNVRAELINLVVDPEYRRQGVARTLISSALKEAEARKVNSVHLETEKDNPANKLFSELGGVPCDLNGYYFVLHSGPRL